ncbi:hypothetical protein ACG7TL_002857 [Trametes sanguinea]
MLRRNALTHILLIVTFINVAYIVTKMKATRKSFGSFEHSYTYQGNDHPGYLPLNGVELSPVSMTVEESESYPLLGPDSDEQWFSLTSTSAGYVRLGEMDRMFMVVMFHELHCLRILNLAFGKASIASLEHIQHCLNYLRLGALCSADLTLEPGDFEERDYRFNRVGATHTCRDWRMIYAVLDENYAMWKNKTAGTL